jgi:hypothetical protein
MDPDFHLSGAGETKYHGQDTPHCIQYPAGTQWRGMDLIGWVPVGEMITEISFSQVTIVGILAGWYKGNWISPISRSPFCLCPISLRQLV